MERRLHISFCRIARGSRQPGGRSDNIRLLGRLLGDTIRDQEGDAVFNVVEQVRQQSVRFRRAENPAARSELEEILNQQARGHTIEIIRAFSYFFHLANIAEDRHHVRRTRAHSHSVSAPREGTMGRALRRANDANISSSQLQRFFAQALICPVLTAHPTEVRRKSAMDREMEISDLLAERDRLQLTPAEQADNEAALRRAILTLWQTSILRRSKLRVVDEVMNGLSYYEYTFLHELPRFYADLEDKLFSRNLSDNGELPSFLKMGSWIGGDRDGNPFVDAKVLRQTLLLQNQVAMKFYLNQVQALGAALPLDARLVGVSKELEHLAAGSERSLASQARRAIPSRNVCDLCAACRHSALLKSERSKAAIVDAATPYTDAGEVAADLDIVHFSLVANGSEPLARGRLRHLRRAVKVFGFHLASLDVRQNSDVHERTISNLLEMALPGTS